MPEKKKQLLYEKLQEQILETYQNKSYYSPLPGERELCDIYNVSRPTVRKALEILEKERCIVRIPGKGAFYIGNKKGNEETQTHTKNIAFFNRVSLRGDYTYSKIMTQKVIRADADIAKVLNIEEGELVFRLERLRYINGELWSLADSYSIFSICPELMNHDYSERSLHNTMASYGHVPHRAKRRIYVRPADEYEAFNLELKPGDMVSIFETLTYDENGELLEFSISRFDALKMSITLDIINQKDGSVGRTEESDDSTMP